MMHLVISEEFNLEQIKGTARGMSGLISVVDALGEEDVEDYWMDLYGFLYGNVRKAFENGVSEKILSALMAFHFQSFEIGVQKAVESAVKNAAEEWRLEQAWVEPWEFQ